MKTSTLLVLLGVSIIAISMITFASFILSIGTSGAALAPAGSAFIVAVLVGFGQILIGRALRPATSESERPMKKEKLKLSQPSLTRGHGRMAAEEEPRIIAVDNQEPAAWLKNTLEKLAEQGSEQGEENVTPAELPGEAVIPSRPRMEDRAKPVATPPPKVRGTLITTPSEFSRATPRKESTFEPKPTSRLEGETGVESEPESILREYETPSKAASMEQEETRPGVRKLREMEITFVERDGITFLEVGTGIHERYPCEDQSLIDYAWRALVRGLKVNVEIEGGKVIKLAPVA